MASRLILVTKFKGGVGATHISALLAHGLAQHAPTVLADYEPQGDGAQILAVPVHTGHGTVRDFLDGTRPVRQVLHEITTAPHGYYLAPDRSLTRPFGQPLCDPDRLRRAAGAAELDWVVVDTVKLPAPCALAFVEGADLVLHVVANAFGLRTLGHTHQQLRQHARGELHTVLNQLRKDPSEAALLADLSAAAELRALRLCPVRIGHDGWVTNALRHGRSPFSLGNARRTHETSVALATWVRERLHQPPLPENQ
ncbi:ParA family protein [Crossiella sp. SN42]|uniref:ParA family protein n=1 Tax=Crossiella sp. SN42 TaxID=2944808 RepID=UPI00207C3F51|nr:ParA family protein [Crossiella sp. SN42]MCO1580494.1 ParA family protein [Crossiella sp. SN42]